MTTNVDLENVDPVLLDRAFRLQEKIKREGLDGIGYMDAAHYYMRNSADSTVSKHIEKSLRSEFGRGVK
ncbi:hypothetical protein [Natronorubrum sulfidifaciens]|uniref:Uncharacterized protein n=1 Tax=Natronorubrum sulfidifaciens JCM 14089 TaxID=1230460 RepID=L9WDF0_9EURY|nr:hypothetical protein [Natronorubrum sulfidifaciens]ELY47306.1 hypothetical protein C495_03572 [Natronorubrum sulfidifaciens JCM 14089]